MEREVLETRFKEIIAPYHGDPVPDGLTELYMTLSRSHSTFDVLTEFSNVKIKRLDSLKATAGLVIEYLYPDFMNYVSEEPDFYTEARELLKLTTRVNIIYSIVLLLGVKKLKDLSYSESMQSLLLIKAKKLIDTSERTSDETRLKAMWLAANV